MAFFSWLRTRTASRAPQGRRSAPGRFRPQLEALEGRCLPSTLTVTSPKDNGKGTLRAEIATAQTGDTIVFSPKLDGKTITLTTGELDLTKNLTIQGPGASQLTISGDNLSRVFEVAENTTVTLSGLAISNGDAGYPGPMAGFGGGILNEGTLTVISCTVSGNVATLFDNLSEGGGIYNAGTLTVSGCTVSDNSAEYGGGLLNWGGWLTLSGCTVSNNSATGAGGGIWAGGFTTVNGCTVSNNYAQSGGGGIYAPGVLTVLNSIFSSNRPDNIAGGYIDGGGNTFS